MLRIVKHRLDDELEIQGEIAAAIGREVTRQESRVQAAEDALAEIKATLLLRFRNSEDKFTVGEVDAKIVLDQEFKAAQLTLRNVQRDHREWLAVRESWRQRSYALTNLANLYGTDYFSQQSASIRASAPGDIDGMMAHRRAQLRGAVGNVGSTTQPSRTRVRMESNL